MKRTSFVLPLLFFSFTFILLVLPGNQLPKAGFFSMQGLDKIIHTIMFFLLTWLFCRPYQVSVKSVSEKLKWFLIIAILAIAYGALMEIVQYFFVPFRSFELADILFDSIGTSFGYLFARIKLNSKEKK